MKIQSSCGNTINKQEYKFEDICAGLKCQNKPIVILKVKYINKTGHFCQKCRDDLLQLELVEEIIVADESSPQGIFNITTNNTTVFSRGLIRS